MRVKEYEYKESPDEITIDEERKKELINSVTSEISKNNTIALFKVLKIGSTDEEYDFVFDWLNENGVDIRGINGSITGEIKNYEQIRRYGQSKRYEFDIVDKKSDPKEEQNFNESKRKRQKDNFLPVEKQTEYFDRIEKGKNPNATQAEKNDAKKAREEFVRGNLRLADWVANFKQFSVFNYTNEELQSFAYEGLIKAVDRFDHNKTYIDKDGIVVPYAFSTYAVPTIIRNMYRAIYKESPLSINMMYEIRELENIITEYEIQNNGQMPSEEDLQNIMGLSEKRIKTVLKAKDFYDKNGKILNSLEEYDENLTDIDKVINSLDDSDRTEIIGNGKKVLGENREKSKNAYSDVGIISNGMYVDLDENKHEEQYDTMHQDLESEIVKNNLMNALKRLTEKEEVLLLARFGILTGEAITLEKAGQILKVTQERARQIEAKGLRKLRGIQNFNYILSEELDFNSWRNDIQYPKMKQFEPLLPPDTPIEKIYSECIKRNIVGMRIKSSYQNGITEIKKSGVTQEEIENALKILDTKHKFIVSAHIGLLTGKTIPIYELNKCFNHSNIEIELDGSYSKIRTHNKNGKNNAVIAKITDGKQHTYNKQFDFELSDEKGHQLIDLYTEFLKREIKEGQKSEKSSKMKPMDDDTIEKVARIGALRDTMQDGYKREMVELLGSLDDNLSKKIKKEYKMEYVLKG